MNQPVSSPPRSPSLVAGLIAGLVVLLIVGLLPSPANAQATAARIDGGNRYDTAAAIAAQDHPGGSDVVVLARADDYADALASAPLARRFGAPVLVTDTGSLNGETRASIASLDPEQVIVFGGTAAISQTVVDQVRSEFNLPVSRIAGANRFSTAVDAALVLSQNGGLGEFPAGRRVAFVTQTDDFAATLAAGAPAAAQGFPILLAETNRLPPETAAGIRNLGIQRVYLIGNTAQLTPALEDAIGGLGVEVIRIAGADRLGTVTALADFAVAAPWLPGGNVVLARGDLFVDTLAAAPHAAAIGAPIILSNSPTSLGASAAAWLSSGTTPTVGVVQAIGGTAALSPDVLAAAVAAADDAGDGDPKNSENQVFIIQPIQAPINEVGEAARFTVTGRYDNLPLPETLSLGLYPCVGADVVGTGPDTFGDIEPDGLADGLGLTDTEQAAFATLNGEDITDTRILRDTAVVNGQITTQVISVSGPDCAIVVAWQDRNGDGQFAVDANGQPVELYGVGKVTFGSTAAVPGLPRR